MKPLNRHAAKRAWKTFNLCIRQMRAKARELGYALAVHGSLARDIDIIAIPWVEEAVAAEQLVEAMVLVIAIQHGWGHAPRRFAGAVKETVKPHGRRAWEIHVWGSYFDFGVMPRLVGGALLE